MKGRRGWLAMAAMAASILGGCDSFSLLDQFVLNGGLRLVPQTGELLPGDTAILYLEGGTGPYSLYCTNGGLYDDGTAIDLGVLDDLGPDYSYTAGASIGPVRIHLVDSKGFSTSATVSVVPHQPASVDADGAAIIGPGDLEITWSYAYADKIEGFRILRSQDGGLTFSPLLNAGSLPKATSSHIDNAASPASMNIYRVYAFAGPYSSSYGQDGSIGQP